MPAFACLFQAALLALILMLASLWAPLGLPAHEAAADLPKGVHLKNRQHAVELIDAYLKLPDPHPEALSALLADEAVQHFGVNAALAMLSRPLLELRLRPGNDQPLPLNPEKSVKLFAILEALVNDLPASTMNRPDKSGAKLIRELQSPEGIMSQGLAQMVETGCAALDPALARFYYRRLHEFPRRSPFDLDRASASLALIKLYCLLDNPVEAEWIYADFKSLERRSGITLRQGQAALVLVESLAAAGELAKARRYYDELWKLPDDKYLTDYKSKAREALAQAERLLSGGGTETETAKNEAKP